MPENIVRLGGGAAVFDPDRISESELRDLLASPPEDRGRPLPGAAGRAGVRLIERGNQSWVWRHNCRGGWCRRISRDAYLWLGERRSRTFVEWRLLDELHRAGLPVPAPVAAFYRRRGLTYSCDLITTYLPGTSSLGSRLSAGGVSEPVWAAIGACIRRFHAANICHADLNAHNVLIGANNSVYLVDFDRGRRRAAGAWMEGNWQRLQRSVEKISGLRARAARPPAGWLAWQLQHRILMIWCLATIAF